MIMFWLIGVCLVAFFVFIFSRHFYNRRILTIHRSYNSAKDDFVRQLNVSSAEKEKFETIVSSMVEGVIIISADGNIEHASPNFCQMLELRSKDTKGRLYWEVIWNQEINASIKQALLHKKAVKKEINIIGPQESFFSMQISPVIGNDGHLIGLVAVFHDITELEKLERMRTEFVANVSHELKTPLTAIKGFVETLRTSAKDDPGATARFLDIIDKQAHRLEDLVNDLLVLSSIESKEVKMTFMPESINKIVQSVLILQKKAIEEKEHDVVVEISPELPKVLVDRQRIEQVFLNLLDNAVKFTPPGGKIHVLVKRDLSYMRIDIKDNGVGIAAEHLSRVFERFYRVDKARSRDAGGTGLGLSIVNQIINAHQGKIEVNSSPNAGSTFTVFLPYQA